MRASGAIVLVTLAAAFSPPAFGKGRGRGRLEPVPCRGNPKYTYGVFLPSAYEREKDRLFPVLFTHSPGGNPGTLGMHDWAERSGIIIVSVNNYANAVVEKASSHDAGWKDVDRIQDAVIESVEATLRVHPCLRFSVGMSGAAWASMRMAGNHNQKHAGVVMLAHSGNGADSKLAKHIMVGFIHAENDKVHGPGSVRGVFKALKRRGHLVREVCGEWGHSNGPLEHREEFMDWMLGVSRLMHPNLPPAEKRTAAEEIKRQIKALAGIQDPAARLKEAETLLAFPGAETWPEAKALLAAWFSAKFDAASALEDPVASHDALTALSQDARAMKCSSSDRSRLRSALSKMRLKSPVRQEWRARQLYDRIARLEKQARTSKTKLIQVARSYQALAKKYRDTAYGRKAAEDAQRLVDTINKKR